MTLSVSVVSPVYRASAPTVIELHRRLSAVADGVDAEFEFVFVDDASPDATFEVLSELAVTDPRVRAVRLQRNVRQIRAIFAGIEVASHDPVILIDSDLEDPPESIPELIELYRRGHDLVVTVRDRSSAATGRRFGSAAINLVARLARLPVRDVGSSFLLMDRRIADGVRRELDQAGLQLLLPTHFALSRSPATCQVTASTIGDSGYPLRTLAVIALQFIARFVAPRLSTPLALVAAVSVIVRARRPRRDAWPDRWDVVAVGALLAAAITRMAPMAVRRDRSEPLYEIAQVIRSDRPTTGDQ